MFGAQIDFKQMNQSPSLPGEGRNPFRVDAIRAMVSQGSSFLATLG
jgi:hypothetical protein